jgi:transposase
MKPTYEELEAKYIQVKEELGKTQEELGETQEELGELQELFKKAIEEIALLKEKLHLNSKNSSKPPSTDPKSNTNKDQQKKKKRKKRKGVARKRHEKVDKQVNCTRENCPHCGSKEIQLTNQDPEILQQVEIPEVQGLITEYLLQKYRCQCCGKGATANLPEGVPRSAFGPRLMGFIATLTGTFHLAKREAVKLAESIYGITMGVGSVSNIEEKVAEALQSAYERIHHFVIEIAFCKHFDETSWRDSGKRHYVWVASCQEAAYYMIDKTRSTQAFQRLIGKSSAQGFIGVTDRYALYHVIGRHQYCLAHLIREFRRYAQRDGPDREIGKALEKHLIFACKIHRDFREKGLSWETRNKRLIYRKNKVRDWLEYAIANGSEQLYHLSERLLDRFERLWTFMKIEGVEPTNNLAERDMRKLVIWRKKSYGSRSARGKRFVERMTTITQTLKRQRKNVLAFVQSAVKSFYYHDKPPLITESLGF